MRGRLDIANADMLTAELRKRLAENTNEVTGSPGFGRRSGPSLGAVALARAHAATALHMHAVAAQRAKPAAARRGDER